jgi:RNA polymerase sigma-70 factor (sigma-E family)
MPVTAPFPGVRRAVDRIDRALDRPLDRALDRTVDRTMERPLDRALELGGGSSGGLDRAGLGTVAAEGTSVDLLTETYQAHYRSLLGLAALLLDDTASCEDVVQEAFIRVHAARRRVREPDKTLAYLRQTVVNLSRSTLRRRIMGLRLLQKPMPDMASAEEGAYDALERDQLLHAMRGLQRRQREVLVLRYFADMTEAQVADSLGISVGSVKAYGSRGLAALRLSMDAAS